MGLFSRLSRHSFKLNLASLLLLTVFLNEYYVYYESYARYWPAVNPKGKRSVLLVADPQIQGLRDEPPSLGGALTRWDSDRYLRLSFQWALWAYKPSTIIFLGDLIDEASTTEDPDTYQSYVDRFYSIYPEDSAPKTIYLPGDNDIGGEGLDPLTEEKVNRFSAHFNGHGSFFQVSKRVQVFTYDSLKRRFPYANKKDSKVRISASHRPLLTLHSPGEYFDKLPGRPSVHFSAHHHRGLVYRHNIQRNAEPPERIMHFSRKNSNGSFALTWHMNDDKDSLYEINVPTCSYRMGVHDMAFGLLTFHKKMGYFQYANLWLPPRFPALGRYALAFFLAGVYIFIYKLRQRMPPGGRFYNVKYTSLGR
eukprot:TRINITY_DN2999_c0_g1_i1.p1 TRINITY_DN2999_c0_g1~~TRINITY_DN2999_c0_g1_i1.p1  ORF type:complete len:364 (+),score=63.83 TRINITY_DN2999_c0_g1_i1:128-1219(+)